MPTQIYSTFIYNLNEVVIDGLPLFKSSKIQMWPILVRIVTIENISFIAVGIFIGKKKPDNICAYISDFMENGIEIKSKIIKLKFFFVE